MCRIQLLELCACKIRRLKRLNATFLIAVDLNFKFDPTGRIMRAKCELNATCFRRRILHVSNSILLGWGSRKKSGTR
jgi:hypothetical protein